MRSDDRILQRLDRKAISYLRLYASTEDRLKNVLGRFAMRKMADEDPERMAGLIDKITADCVRKGYLNDRQFAERKTRIMRGQGRSHKQIQQKLYEYGIDASSEEKDHRAELVAGLVFARKRQIGPYSIKGGRTKEGENWRQKHFGRFARAGYSYQIAEKIMSLNTIEEAEELTNENIKLEN